MPDVKPSVKAPWFLLCGVFLLLSTRLLPAQLIDVDFNQNNGPGWGGGGPNPGPTMSGAAVLGVAGDHWNGIDVNTGSGMALIYATGSSSPVTMTFTSAGGYDANSYSGATPFAGTAYDALMEDYLYTGTPQTITLSGLAASSAYKLVLYNAADKSSSAVGRTTYFTVNGSTLTSTWDGASSTLINGVDYVEFNCALADAFGNLTITYNGNGTVEGDVDGFQIQPAPASMNAAQNGTNILLSFSAELGLSYQMEYKTNLLSATWTLLGSPVYGSNAVQSVSDLANAHSSRFYRLLVSTNLPAAVSLLHASGTNIVNASGDVVLLKGLNLGGWFIMEKWMCPLDVDANLPDTYSVITNLDSRFGVATEQSLVHGYQTNWITLTDLNNITNGGFNCVRMPVWWGNFYSINNTTSTGWRADAFSVLDWLVTNCAARGIYVVIDMHGVVGGQGTSDDTGWQNQNQYWTNVVDQSETTYMWTQIATHYKGNPAVAGYDLINEPDGTTSTGDVWPAYASLYTAIRAVDPSRMLIMEGTFGNWDWSMLPNPATYHWTNIVYSMHEYVFGGDVAQVEAGSDGQVSDFDNHLSWNVPSYVGEWNDMGQGAACYEYSINDYTSSGQNWCMWAYKATDGLVPDGWGWYDPTYWPTTPNISSDSAATIANDWTQWRTTTSFGTNAAVGL
jgi:endoglucanase